MYPVMTIECAEFILNAVKNYIEENAELIASAVCSMNGFIYAPAR